MIVTIRRTLLAVAWIVVIVVLALGSAGIVAQWSHPPGTPARAELTWRGDQAIKPRLDLAQSDLQAIAGRVERLAVLARGALAAVTSGDQDPFRAAISEGGDTSRAIESASTALRFDLIALPGDVAADSITYGSDVLARRASMLTALDSTTGLGRDWARLTSGSVQASDLIGLLTSHDLTVATAAAEGRAANYESALGTLALATTKLDAAADIRDQVANTADVTTLDEWVSRNRRYDTALIGLYTALQNSGGLVDDAVRAAYREESAARAVLPPDTRGLVVIVADIGRGGLNQAVIAIEQARGRLNIALQALGPAEGDGS